MAKTDTVNLIKYLKEGLFSINVPMPKTTRGGPHVRTAIDGDFESKFKRIAKVKFSMLDRSISGSFPTYEIKLLKEIEETDGFNIPKGTTCLFVNSRSAKGSVNNKEFTPDALGCAGKRYTSKQLYEKLCDVIKTHPKFNKVGAFMLSLTESSYNNSDTLDFGDSVSTSDIAKIAKDFGELTGALWLMNTKYKGKAFFPLASNEPLIDYIIETKTGDKKISAKAGKGAPPSINVVADALKAGEVEISNAEKKYAKIIIDISESSTIDGILKASETYNTPGYREAKKLLGKVTRSNIENYLNNFPRWDLAEKATTKFHKSMNRSVSKMMWERIYGAGNSKVRKDGIMISPMGYHLVDRLNRDIKLTDLLNKVLSSLTVEQLYLLTNGTKLNYKLVPFKDGKFVFHYNANAGNPSLKKISFKMK